MPYGDFMQFKIEKIKNMPYAGKVGVTLWVVSWIWLIAVYYYLTQDTTWVAKLSIAVVLLALFLLQAQNWARLIAVLGNVMGILLSGYFYLGGFILFATVNVMLFGGAIYFLMIPAVSRYFKAQNQPDAPTDSSRR
jgi:hypothetical protein